MPLEVVSVLRWSQQRNNEISGAMAIMVLWGASSSGGRWRKIMKLISCCLSDATKGPSFTCHKVILSFLSTGRVQRLMCINCVCNRYGQSAIDSEEPVNINVKPHGADSFMSFRKGLSIIWLKWGPHFHFVSSSQSWLNMEETKSKRTSMSGIRKKEKISALQGQSGL